MSKHKIYVGQRVVVSDGTEGVVLSIGEWPFGKLVAQVRYQGCEKTRSVYVDALTPAPLTKPKSEPVAKPGDRVRDIHGKEGVVVHTSVLSDTPVADILYSDESLRRAIRTATLTVLPTKEEVKSGDRVQHTAKVNPTHRRTNGTATGSILSNGTSINVLWPGGVYRTELLSQLEVTHPAEDNSTTVEQALELLRGEYRTAAGKIEELQAYKDSLGVAIDALVEVVDL